MINTLTTLEAVHELGKYECFNSFSYEGTKALVEHLESTEEDMGHPIEFDPVSFAYEYSEYDGLLDFAEQNFMNYREEFGIDYENPMTGELEENSSTDCGGLIHEELLDNITEYINDNGFLISLENGGILVQNF